MSFLKIDRLQFHLGDWQLRVSLRAERGDCIALIGPSGAGKSTLLSLIAGFEQPDDGRIFVQEQRIDSLAPAARPVTMMFQENNLFNHLTLYQNIALGCHPGLKLTDDDCELIEGALKATQLGALRSRKPADVSGGERQRAALARCLCQKRPLLLLDEPFTGLDPRLRTEMHDLVDALRKNHGLTVIVVSHLPQEVARIADTLAFMHDGRIQEHGPTEATLTGPESSELKEYLRFTAAG
jgi:thiamine transport system ATP-binding protein